jgi:hypothetical protein
MLSGQSTVFLSFQTDFRKQREPTWTTGLETRRGLKVNLQPKERAESDMKETVIIGRSNNCPEEQRF